MRKSAKRDRRGEVRWLGEAGASVALTRVPTLAAEPHDRVLVDVELLMPDRLVRYLARPLSRRFLEELAEFCRRVADERLPELSVATVQDAEAGLAVLVVESTPFTVVVEFLVVSRPEGVPEEDGVSFEVPRAAMITAAHELDAWSA